MEAKNVLVYEGKYGDHITSVINAMIALSKKEGKPVKTTFNKATFSVTANTKPDEALKLWEQSMKKSAEAYQNSPEGIKAAAEEKARQEKKAREDAEVSELIKDEVLELTAEKAWKVGAKINAECPGAIHYAERWGKLMQLEMRKQGTNVLNIGIVRATKFKADNIGMSGTTGAYACNLLIQCWKHGAELGRIEGFSAVDVEEARRKAEAL